MKLMLLLLIKIKNLKMLFSKVISIKSIFLNLTLLIEVNTEMVVIFNMKLLNIEVIIVLYQL